MHALVVDVSLQPGHKDEGIAELENNVVPSVKQAPGVVAGYWTGSPDGTHGTSMILFETEEAAKAGAEMARTSPTPDFVTFDKLEVCEVVAHF
jgi:hypothetical protein